MRKISVEREERVKKLLEACEGTVLNRSHFLVPDNSGHEVTISSAVFVALLAVVKEVDGPESIDVKTSLELLNQAASMGVVNPG